MRKNQLFLGSIAFFMMVSCAPKHYHLASVERSRIIIDSRFDHNPDEEAAKFIEPYKRVNDSIMGPVVGVAAHNMHQTRPESDLSNLLADILVWAANLVHILGHLSACTRAYCPYFNNNKKQ